MSLGIGSFLYVGEIAEKVIGKSRWIVAELCLCDILPSFT
jgi:hypothetical protein